MGQAVMIATGTFNPSVLGSNPRGPTTNPYIRDGCSRGSMPPSWAWSTGLGGTKPSGEDRHRKQGLGARGLRASAQRFTDKPSRYRLGARFQVQMNRTGGRDN